MDRLDLFSMRESVLEQDIMICFNGPFSRPIIEELGNAVRRYMESAATERGAMMDVFSVYFEQTPNVRNHLYRRDPEDLIRQPAIVMIAHNDEGSAVCPGKVIDHADGVRRGTWEDRNDTGKE